MKFLEEWWFWFGFSFLLYANTLNHEYTVDDLIVVTSNDLTQKGISGIPEIFKHSYLFGYDGREDESYRPLTLATFAIEKSFFDAKPSTSHLIQVVLYGLCILVLFKFLMNLFGAEKKNLVVVITLLFMLHPIHTEVVSNVKSRDELLSALFLFSSLFLYSKWILEKRTINILLSMLLFFAATLSKETAVLGVLLFPATFLFIGSDNLWRIFKNSLMFAVPFLLYFGLRSLVLTDVLIQDPIDPVANSLALAKSGGEAFTSNLSIFAKYLELAFFPLNMSWDYSVSTFPLSGFGTVGSFIGIIAISAILGLMVFGLLKRNLLGFGALIFVSTFALTSNFFFLINCTLGERFLFMPVLGIIIIVVLLADKLLKGRSKVAPMVLLGIFTVFFFGRTVTRSLDWKNNLTIYESGVAVSPNSVKTHFNLATEYLEQGNKSSIAEDKQSWYSKSLKHFKIAKKIYPQYVNIYENMGFVYAELAKISTDSSRTLLYYHSGLIELDNALDSLGLEKPTLYQNKFFILEQLISLSNDTIEKQKLISEMIQTVHQKKDKTAEDYQREMYYLRLVKEDMKLLTISKQLLNEYPDKKDYVLELSKEYFAAGKYNESYKLVNLYLDYFPNDLSTKSNKGMLLEILGRKKEALEIYEEILAVDPNQAHTRDLYEKLKSK